MTTKIGIRSLLSLTLALVVLLSAGGGSTALASSSAQQITAPPPNGFALEFVSSAADGYGMNAAGDVVGTSYQDTGCGFSCLPPLDTVVWLAGVRTVLPTVPGLTGIYAYSINAQGWVAGYAGFPGTTTHAVVWKLNGSAYQAIDLGTLPGTTISTATGIDDLGRVVGWSTTSPFMWTETGGMVDLSALGYPDEAPTAISPGGTVATASHWYVLGNPASAVLLPPPPAGFLPGGGASAINNAGDQAFFLGTTGTENLIYPFRFNHTGSWQQISFAGTGHLAPAGIGSINDALDITGTTIGAGVIAYGPDGLAQGLAGLISPAYGITSVSYGGPQGSAGKILTRVIIGQSHRLVRLTPATACTTNCIRVSSLVVKVKFITPVPGQCLPTAYNSARVTITVTNENGAALSGVTVNGHLLDDYWTNAPFSGRTNRNGIVSFKYTGPPCVGALAFIVDNATKTGLTFDNTTGVLTAYTIPQ